MSESLLSAKRPARIWPLTKTWWPFSGLPPDEVAIGRDLGENDLCKVSRSARCLAVDARDFRGDLCPLGGVQAAFDGNDGIGRHGISSLFVGLLIRVSMSTRPSTSTVRAAEPRPPARARRTIEQVARFS